MTKSSSRSLAIVSGIGIFIVAIFIGLVIIPDYIPDSSFLHFRLATNVQNGHGLVYNTSENTLVTLSPFYAVILSLSPASVATSATVLSALSYAIIAFILVNQMRNHQHTLKTTVFVVLIVTISWAMWSNIRSPYPIAFALNMLAVHLVTQSKSRYVGIIAGISPLIHLSGIIGLIMVGLFAITRHQSKQYWQIVWIPFALWLIVALISYENSGFEGLFTLPLNNIDYWQNLLWLGIFALISAIALKTKTSTSFSLLFMLWATTEISASLLTTGTISGFASIALVISIAFSVSEFINQREAKNTKNILYAGISTLAISLIVLFPPQLTDQQIENKSLAQQIDITNAISILHDRGDSFAYYLNDFNGDIYHLNGSYSPQISAFTNVDDWQTLIAFTAPDYVLISTENDVIDFDAPNIVALDYAQINEQDDYQLWERTSEISAFTSTIPYEAQFSTDVELTHIRVDQITIQPDDVLRLGLDWSLDRLPEDGMTINVTLLDYNNEPVVSIFPFFPLDIWQVGNISTYHAIHIPENAEYGLYRVQITLDYQAGILGRFIVHQLPIPTQTDIDNNFTTLGNLGSISISEPHFTLSEVDDIKNLIIDLQLSTSAILNTDYNLFAHITPLDDLSPVTQGDGLITNGRYPTQWWQINEVVPERRIVELQMLPAGEYRINIGIYTVEAGRLQNESGDFLTIGYLNVDEDGTIEVNNTPID